MYEVRTQEFSGPLEKLLELIEERKMDVTQVSLAAVTADFLHYIEDLKKELGDGSAAQEIQTRFLADFLVVAAQLILIKSKALLPQLELSEEEEATIQDLERRLALYRDVKPIFATLRLLWTSSPRAFTRSSLYQFQPVFYPPPNVTLQGLSAALDGILNVLQQFLIESDTIERQLVSLESKIDEVITMVSASAFRFSDITGGRSREEIIVLFLAVLHLLCDRLLRATQQKVFGEIRVATSSQEH
jgi:segregation and condensation protein A